jgi:hypothetical protein
VVRDALKTLEAAIELPKFDPATSTRTFTLAANDFTTIEVLRTEAPRRESPFIQHGRYRQIVVYPNANVHAALITRESPTLDFCIGDFEVR